MKKFAKWILVAVLVVSTLTLAACGNDDAKSASGSISGDINMDGSSTVFPIMEAVAETYMGENSDVRVSVGVAGTGGGFEKFTKGETDFSNASRRVKSEEMALAKENGVQYTELQVGYDGLTVVVNKENDFIDYLTVAELKKIWVDDGTIKTWNEIRPEWPKEEIKFYSPGHDSGTYDYFDEVILGGAEIEKTAQLSEDDNVLVKGVEGDENAIGYFGYAYYLENKDELKVVPIDNGSGPIKPSSKTIADGTYAPLSRPLYTYLNNASYAGKPQVKDFTAYLLENASQYVEEVGYVSLPVEDYQSQLADLAEIE